jgi:hypothetical protein
LRLADNSGPPTVDSVLAFWNATRVQFPNARILVSSIDAFTKAIAPLAATLPVVSSEIGQSWSYGAPAAADKLAVFRESLRQRNAAVAAGTLPELDPSLLAWERRLLLAGPE